MTKRLAWTAFWLALIAALAGCAEPKPSDYAPTNVSRILWYSGGRTVGDFCAIGTVWVGSSNGLVTFTDKELLTEIRITGDVAILPRDPRCAD